MSKQAIPAPEWDITQWFNSDCPLSVAVLQGKVIVAGAFQMLCPGCVSHLLPQLKAVRKLFPASHVAVVGLHTVFEHHDAMGPVALKAFLHEYRIDFPVGVDRASETSDPLPVTMRRYAMNGTPTLLLIDREGHLRRQIFGHIPDLQLGAEIAALLNRQDLGVIPTTEDRSAAKGCDDEACAAE